MFSKQVIDLEKRTQALEAFLAAHGDTIRDGVTARTEAMIPEGQTPPDIDAFQTLIQTALEGSRELLLSADRAHEAETSDDGPPRRDRDLAAQRVRTRLLHLQAMTDGLFGGDQREAVLGFQGLVSQDPTTLLQQARQAMTSLRSPDLLPFGGEFGEVSVSPEQLAQALEAPTLALEEALLEVHRQRGDAQVTQTTREALRQEHFELLRSSADLVAGLCRLAGRPDLSDRARAAVRKKRRGDTTTEEPEPETPPGGQPGTETPPGPEPPRPGPPGSEIPFPFPPS